jgi:hypothetical protein
MNDGELDDLIRSAAMAEPLNSDAVEREVRGRLHRRRWTWLAGVGIAAALALAALGTMRVPREYKDAVRDHRLEVVEHRPRHWRMDPADLRRVENQHPITVPAGYRLKEAKTCGIAGRPVMHLVYTDGSRDVSVYVTGHPSGAAAVIDGQQVRPFRSGRETGLIVGSPAECRQFADVIQRST